MTAADDDARRESVPRRPAGAGGPAGGGPGDRWQLPDADPGDPAAWEARLRGLAEAVGELAASARRLADRPVRARPPAPDEAAVAEAVAAAGDVATGHLTELAPGIASLDGESSAWTSPEYVGAATPFHVRVGTVGTVAAATPQPIAAVLPLLGTGGWYVSGGGDPIPFVRDVVLRTLAAAEPGRVRLDVVDLAGTGGPPGLDDLRVRAPSAVAPVTDRTGVAALFGELVLLSAQRGSELLRLGRSGFEDVPDDVRRPGEAYRLVVVAGDPATLPDDAVRELRLVAETAGERGICLLVADPAGEVASLRETLRAVTITGADVRAAGLDGVPIAPDPPLSPGRVDAVAAAVADALDRHAEGTAAAETEDPAERSLWTFLRAELGEDVTGPAVRRPGDLATVWAEYVEALQAVVRATRVTAEPSGDDRAEDVRRRADEVPAAVRAALARMRVPDEGVAARVLLPAPRSTADALALLDRAERQVTEDGARLESARAVDRAAEAARRHGRRLLVGGAVVLLLALIAAFVIVLVATR